MPLRSLTNMHQSAECDMQETKQCRYLG